MNNRPYVSIFVTSIIILVTTLSAYAEGISLLYSNENNIELLSVEADLEKNVTNVKVSYNPVAEQISVSFKLGKQSTVAIKLMDALGNEILNLSNSILESGMQNFSYDTEGKVSTGFYFVRVTSGTETVVKRVSIR